MQSQNKRRPSTSLANTTALWRQWQELAGRIWAKQSGLSAFEAARRIQQSPAGKKRPDSPLRYSVSYIAKAIYGVRKTGLLSNPGHPESNPSPWHRMQIPASSIADVTAGSLIGLFRSSYRAGGSPKGPAVYHLKTKSGDHIFYLCPQASSICANILLEFPAVKLDAPASLKKFTVVMP